MTVYIKSVKKGLPYHTVIVNSTTLWDVSNGELSSKFKLAFASFKSIPSFSIKSTTAYNYKQKEFHLAGEISFISTVSDKLIIRLFKLPDRFISVLLQLTNAITIISGVNVKLAKNAISHFINN